MAMPTSNRQIHVDEGRTRQILYGWPRIPNGRVLERHRAPVGFRTPNDLIWGHYSNEICYIDRVPSIPNFVTMYSRSQIKELGEHYKDDEWKEPLDKPRIRRPWPVLKLPPGDPAQPDPPLGAIDVGCGDVEHSKSEFKTYTMRWDETKCCNDRGQRWMGFPVVVEPRRCPTDPAAHCVGRLVSNDGPEPVKKPGQEHPYHYLWCEHFVARLEQEEHPMDLVVRTIHLMPNPYVSADTKGVFIMPKPDDWRKVASKPSFVLHDDGLQACQGPAIPESAGARYYVGESAEDILGDTDFPSTAPSTSTCKAQEPQKQASAPDLFSVTDLPKLEEFIPESLFPDVLLVHDPDRVTNHQQLDGEPVKYRRVWPKLGDADKEVTKESENVAHLHLLKANRFGEGHHSYVYRAPLTLPPPLSAHSRTGQYTVAAKLAYSKCSAHRLLRNEGKVYDSLPKHTQQDYCGVNLVPPYHYPVPVGAIAPKFFGYYLPVDEDGEVVEHYHDSCGDHRPCHVEWVSPILLMEECGKPVEPKKLTADQRSGSLSLILRLHELNIIQGSSYVRNVLIQPGPLIFPPEKRIFDRPSFRVIDFGRGECLATSGRIYEGMSEEERMKAKHEFFTVLRNEHIGAREQLLVQPILGF